MIRKVVAPFAFAMLAMSGCAGSDTEQAQGDSMVAAADESVAVASEALTGSIKFGSRLVTTDSVNIRKGAGTSSAVRAVVPKGETVRVVDAKPQNGWYNVNWDGLVGWISGSYLQSNLVPDTKREEATARAISVWGFSYHWGQGDWDPTSQSPGSCSGSCGTSSGCTHSGTNGSDCSGMVAKAWVVPESNTPTTKVYHPYSTADFYGSNKYWSRISRNNLKEADALVYRDGGSGHVFFFQGGDGWGAMQAIECKGCAAGCLYNTRSSVSSSYVAIRRTGY